MRVLVGDDSRTRIVMFDESKNCYNGIILIFQRSGGGKSLFAERIAEEYHKKGYTVVSLLDVKDEFEYAYSMFEPQEKFHLNELRKEGIAPSKYNVRLYHPFTFNIPRNKLPEFRFFTFSLKNLNRERISYLTETHSSTDSVELILDAVENLGNDDSVYDLVHGVQKSIETKKKRVHGREILMPDKNAFFLNVGMKGTKTNISEVASVFKGFNKDYFLAPHSFDLNLNVRKEIFENPDRHHILTTKWIKDEKRKYFVVLSFFDEIIKNMEYAKKPMVFLIDEIGSLVPREYTHDYRMFLADYFRKKLMTIRSQGRGNCVIGTSQVYHDVSEKIKGKGSIKLFGNMGSVEDIDRITKALKYGKDTLSSLRKMERNNYLLSGEEEMEEWTALFPTHCHAEAKYNFFEMYKKFYPEKIRKYGQIIDMVRNHIKEIQDRFSKTTKKEVAEKTKEAEEEEQIKKEKSNAEREKKEIKEKLDNLVKMSKEEKVQRCLELYEQGKKYRDIAKITGIGKSTVGKYVKMGLSLPNLERDKLKYEDIVESRKS